MVIAGPDGRQFKTGDIVQHFKRVWDGKDAFPDTDNFQYMIIGEGVSTVDLTPLVIYQALYDDRKIWVRPLMEFFGEVDKKKYPNCGQDFRFIKVQDGTEADNN